MKGFGRVQFCNKQINPCFDLVFEKKKPAAAGGPDASTKDDKDGNDKKGGDDTKKGKDAVK